MLRVLMYKNHQKLATCYFANALSIYTVLLNFLSCCLDFQQPLEDVQLQGHRLMRLYEVMLVDCFVNVVYVYNLECCLQLFGFIMF